MAKQSAPISLRLKPETEARLTDAAERLHMKRNKLAQDAIEAAVDAIERSGFRLVVPIEFEVTHVPVKTEAPAAGQARPGAAAGGRSSGSTAGSRYKLEEGETEPAPRVTREPAGPRGSGKRLQPRRKK